MCVRRLFLAGFGSESLKVAKGTDLTDTLAVFAKGSTQAVPVDKARRLSA